MFPRWVAGFALGDDILILRGWERYEPVIEHEFIHVLQYRRLGILGFLWRYFWYYLTAMIAARSTDPHSWYPYHPLEDEAIRRSGFLDLGR